MPVIAVFPNRPATTAVSQVLDTVNLTSWPSGSSPISDVISIQLLVRCLSLSSDTVDVYACYTFRRLREGWTHDSSGGRVQFKVPRVGLVRRTSTSTSGSSGGGGGGGGGSADSGGGGAAVVVSSLLGLSTLDLTYVHTGG
jgi:hypothetical protein